LQLNAMFDPLRAIDDVQEQPRYAVLEIYDKGVVESSTENIVVDLWRRIQLCEVRLAYCSMWYAEGRKVRAVALLAYARRS